MVVDLRVRLSAPKRRGVQSPAARGISVSHLGLQITGFTAGRAIVDTVFAEANVMEALAKRAVFITGAASFRLITEHAGKIFGHSRRLARFGSNGNGPMVDEPAGRQIAVSRVTCGSKAVD